ncbi:MAG: nicotinate-nucleotide adenylyltransferase [Proteobacteria bacterium]|nr:nicotinate-nucleotide adenylyltransferase [Pseudomonadota bacterium]
MPVNGPLGIFGGTFDPLHYGHLRLAEEACQTLGLTEVRWIPAGQPPHRAAPLAPAAERMAMVRLGIAANPLFSLDDSEALRGRPSYSVPTLARLRAQVGAHRPLVLLLGADAFLGLTGWHRWQELFQLAHLAIATRPGFELASDQLEAALADEFRQRQSHAATALAAVPAGRILTYRITALDISATGLRAIFKAGGSGRYLLPDPVLDYIATHRIYA